MIGMQNDKKSGNSPFFIAEIYLVESVKLIVYNTQWCGVFLY